MGVALAVALGAALTGTLEAALTAGFALAVAAGAGLAGFTATAVAGASTGRAATGCLAGTFFVLLFAVAMHTPPGSKVVVSCNVLSAVAVANEITASPYVYRVFRALRQGLIVCQP
jgi:hypothetical protein